MITIFCALASAAGFYLSLNLGDAWPLAWLAPIPVLWLAFGETRRWTVFAAAWASYAIGCCNILPAYGQIMPPVVIAIALTVPALFFAVSVLAAARLASRIGPLTGVLAFATFWTSFDYLASLTRNGTELSPAYSQVGAPFLIQGVSLFGPFVVTFLLGLVAAGIATSLRKRTLAPAVVAIAVFAANAGFGVLRISDAPPTPELRVGLAADDSRERASLLAKQDTALDAVDAYAATVPALARDGAKLIVFPEKLAVLMPQWSKIADYRLLSAARSNGVEIVIGVDDRGTARRNAALIFPADGSEPQAYFKRRMVEGLEDGFVPGGGNFVQPDKTGVAICKDMDYQAMLRSDARLGHPTLLAVPAWDFGLDGWWHARLAIMRGVENGFAVARAAKDGLLTLSDAYGRVLARKPTSPSGMVTLVGSLPRGPGDTPYQHIGDAFAWACVAASIGLAGFAVLKRS